MTADLRTGLYIVAAVVLLLGAAPIIMDAEATQTTSYHYEVSVVPYKDAPDSAVIIEANKSNGLAEELHNDLTSNGFGDSDTAHLTTTTNTTESQYQNADYVRYRGLLYEVVESSTESSKRVPGAGPFAILFYMGTMFLTAAIARYKDYPIGIVGLPWLFVATGALFAVLEYAA